MVAHSLSDGKRSTTFGESNMKLPATLTQNTAQNTAKSPTEDQRLETLLTEARENNTGAIQEANGANPANVVQAILSPAASELQKLKNEIRERRGS